jgi:hypothetical protein
MRYGLAGLQKALLWGESYCRTARGSIARNNAPHAILLDPSAGPSKPASGSSNAAVIIADRVQQVMLR